MTKNIGTFDRIVRILIGVILLGVAVSLISNYVIKIIILVVALFCFYEALASWCLLYRLLGKNTCPME